MEINEIYFKDMYIKGGDMESAREMFDNLKHRTIVEFNSLML